MKPIQLGPWPVGANNRLPEYALTTNKYGHTIALRRPVNVDIDNSGHVRRRSGFVRTTSGIGLDIEKTIDPFDSGWTKAPTFNGRKYRVTLSGIEFTVPFPTIGEEVDVDEFNQIPFPDINIFEPVPAGIWVITATATYFLAGTGPEDFVQREVLPYGGVKGTSVRIPNSENVIWYSQRGAVIGSSDGQAKNIQEEYYSAPSATEGTATIIETRGVRKYIVSLINPIPSPLALS